MLITVELKGIPVDVDLIVYLPLSRYYDPQSLDPPPALECEMEVLTDLDFSEKEFDELFELAFEAYQNETLE